MANEQNLIPLQSRTQRERNEIALQGANASNKVQRQKKQLQHQFQMLMSLELKDNDIKKQVQSLGMCGENIVTVETAMCAAITQRALNGSFKAFEIIRDMLGENPKNQIQIEEKEIIQIIKSIKYSQDVTNPPT